MKDLNPIADFLFETGMLAKTPRSGFFFLGSGKQSVAEHINRVTYIGYCLAHMFEEKIDVGQVVQMCMFHDISESRISDLNYVHQKYTERFEDRAHEDLIKSLPFGNKIEDLLAEYSKRETTESKIAKDADNLELLLSLKEQIDIGNKKAETWVNAVLGRIKTTPGQALAQKILETNSDRWWYGDMEDSWWVNRNK